MEAGMQKLPIGIQTFEKIRLNNYVYVDKTRKILELTDKGDCYFISRPRRFGKSLTLSTLEAMFKGQSELFRGLYAEDWVRGQAKRPNPVIRLDMSGLAEYGNRDELNNSIINYLERYYVKKYKLNLRLDKKSGDLLLDVIGVLYERFGPVVVLIDEYDKPITDNIDNLEKAEEMRGALRSFYLVLKGCGQYLRFVMVTGVSKFSRAGVFSGLNNLEEISMDKEYGDIVGYTQQELEDNFGEWIDIAGDKLSMDREELLAKIRQYYDGFSFDGTTSVYNPFSILNFFKKSKFRNYWYVSGSPSFLLRYLQGHRLQNPDKYEEITVPENFSDKREIESASVESFLFQAGYLTIKKWVRNEITLGYPNEEVRSSLADMYLDDVYRVEGYLTLGNDIWRALEEDDFEGLVKSFNLAISGVPYEDFGDVGNSDDPAGECPGRRREYWYRTMFVMLLRGAGVIYYAEVHTCKGRPDVVVEFKDKVTVIEFKLARDSSEVDLKRREGLGQIKSRDYVSAFEGSGRKVTSLVLVADDSKRQIAL